MWRCLSCLFCFWRVLFKRYLRKSSQDRHIGALSERIPDAEVSERRRRDRRNGTHGPSSSVISNHKSVSQSVNQSVSQSISRSAGQAVSRSTSVSQSVSHQSISQSVSHSVPHPLTDSQHEHLAPPLFCCSSSKLRLAPAKTCCQAWWTPTQSLSPSSWRSPRLAPLTRRPSFTQTPCMWPLWLTALAADDDAVADDAVADDVDADDDAVDRRCCCELAKDEGMMTHDSLATPQLAS